ncbi:hypothetical protein ACIOC2_05220 [Streptomyces sp. NPDC088337]|uniref:hypothetical protein n=1 Tax=unclassified Streptomyces TaxID=2593676 RepID=UPI002DD85D07|nr:hypothetical protein [Streptomyces sp. NBC_01788]WSB26245.1 hypothetical protein OIE49_10270 [Streptomyces sp. NBC_01788]
MGIRMLNRRPAVIRVDIGEAPKGAPLSVRPFAPDAGTARVPADLTATLRRAASGLRDRFGPGDPVLGETRAWRLWADTARGYLALLLSPLHRPRPVRSITVFVATATPTGDRLGEPSPHRSRQDRRNC